MIPSLLLIARFPRHHALKYMTSIITPFATVVAVAVATNRPVH